MTVRIGDREHQAALRKVSSLWAIDLGGYLLSAKAAASAGVRIERATQVEMAALSAAGFLAMTPQASDVGMRGRAASRVQA